jgi:hypothetical protein
VLTSSQIVADACVIAKAPGFIAIGGRQLNLVLNDLVLHRDLKVNRKLSTFTAQAGSNGPFSLGSDYLRTYDMWYEVNNFPYFLFQMGQDQFDALFKDPSIANYPYAYATDLSSAAVQSAVSVMIYPQTNSQLTINHRYMVNRPDIPSPEASAVVPWFQDQDYLVHATATRIMKITDDARYNDYVAQGEAMLKIHLIMDGDEQQVVKKVRLDPQQFHVNRALRPTKLNPY